MSIVHDDFAIILQMATVSISLCKCSKCAQLNLEAIRLLNSLLNKIDMLDFLLDTFYFAMI